MAPTIQSGHMSQRENRQRAIDRKSELVCRIKYCNTLPDIPFDPKFITYPFESNRFVSYNPTSLERNYKHELLTEHDLGVTIDLINPETYAVDPNGKEKLQLDLADERLLEEDVVAPQDSKRSQHHAKRVSWLRRTEYISTEFTRFQPSSDKTETKVGYNVKKFFKEQDLYMDRDSQIKAIDKTFDDAKITVEKHYSKPGVTPVEVLSIYPDFDLWRYPCAQVIFDSDPAPANRSVNVQIEEMSQAMIRGVMDESGEQFVAYFLPTEETTTKRKRDIDDSVEYRDEEEYDYKMAREYNWNVKNKASKGYEENYFFVFRETGVYYNELETKVRLSKRRVKAGVQPNNSRLIVKHRPLNAQEFKLQEVRLMQLEPPQEEEEEMEVEDKSVAKASKEKAESNSEPEDNDKEAESGSEIAEDSDNDDQEMANEENEKDKELEPEQKGEEEEEEAKDKDKDKEKNASNSPSGSSSSSSSSASGSDESASGSDSESDEDEVKKKRDEEEIFGSDSD
uniref:RNA polymerase II-associated factor 1 homolog n=1 Tax=Strigamia maritima TaxID=126957 RepID=T1JIF2_STRMM